jgi:hypothetical protein
LILNDLGSTAPKKDNQGNPMFQTVCHGGKKHKLYYYADTYSFRCYTDCQESFDVYELVIKAKSENGETLTFPQAVQYIANLTGRIFTKNSAIERAESHIIDDWKWIEKYRKKEKPQIDLPIYNKTVLDVFLNLPHESWLNDGISINTMYKFGIGYYVKDDRITIPHYDTEGNLVGLRGRAMREEDIEAGRKYMPLIVENQLYNHPTMFNLYGLHKTRKAISRFQKVIIFESEKSVLKCEDYYGEDNFSVATAGGSISNFHRDLLLKCGVKEVIIAADKEFHEHESDEAYTYAEKMLKFARKFTPYVTTYIMWDELNLLSYKDSPCDKGKHILEQLMKCKYEIKTAEGRD